MFYSKKVLSHFKNPKNYGRMNNPSGIGEVGNPVCGDMMTLYIKVGKNKKGEEIISDVKFQTFGCVAAIAVSSAATETLKGKTLEEAQILTGRKVIDSLGGLPTIKKHCSMLAIDALSEAIYDYFKENNRPIPKRLQVKHKAVIKEEELIKKKFGESK